MSRTTRLTLLTLAGLLIGSPGAFATEALRKEMTELGKAIKEFLAEEKRTDIAVGDFTGPPQLDSQFGPGIQKILIEELGKVQVSVNKRADLSVSGNYADDAEPRFGEKQLVVKINARILARNGDEKHRLTTRVIKDNTTIAKIAGVTTTLPPNGDANTRNEKIKEAINDPKVHIAGTKVSATPKSEFAVEVCIKGSPRAPQLKEGQAFVDINKDEIYELRVHNNAKHETAVSVSIDGVDMFAFSEEKKEDGKPKFSHYILDPKTHFDVTGWYVNSDPKRKDNVLSFLVTELGKGAASKLGVTGKTGIITVTFAAAGTHPTDLPDDDGGRNASKTETGFGPPRQQQVKEVKRTIGAVREVVSIRYSH